MNLPPAQGLFLHLDCRHFRGDRPCSFARLCEGCPHYAPMGRRVLIVKLAALGDVVRTACLLPTLTQSDDPPHVTWLTSPAARPLVERMPGVDRVLTFGAEALAHLAVEHFDLVLSLDKEPGPAAAALLPRAGQRLGIGVSRYGTVYPLNEQAHDYFRLGLDDDEKFHRNRKSYPQLIHEALGLEWRGQPYRIEPTPADRASAAQRLEQIGARPGQVLLGLNAGAGAVFANKAWREQGYVDLILQLAHQHPHLRPVLLGGPDETALMERIAAAARKAGATVLTAGGDLDLGAFAALIERCAVVVSGDTLAMHLALATGRRAVAIFGPTSAPEIEMYGRGAKVVTTIDCAPCYRRACDKSPHCQDQVATERVLVAVEQQLAAADVKFEKPNLKV